MDETGDEIDEDFTCDRAIPENDEANDACMSEITTAEILSAIELALRENPQAMEQLIGTIRNVQVNQPVAPAAGYTAASSVPRPPLLELEGDMERNYNFFEMNWKTYASAVGMDEWPVTQNKQKTSILLSVVGKDALKKYFNFELNDEQQNDPNLALAAIKLKVVRERNKFVDWFDFFSLLQDAAESIDNYLCRLKSLAKLCKFGVLEEDMIKYKLATSIKCLKLRSKLITTQNLTEASAMNLCRAEEITERHPATVGQSSVEVNMVKKEKMKCKFCGGRHDFTKGVCPALGKRCNRCGGKNHFEKVCRAERKKQFKKKLRVKKVDEDSSSGSESPESSGNENTELDYGEDVSIGKIIDRSGSGGHVLADLDLFLAGKWQVVQCELDTGANTSLVGHDWLEKMTENSKIELLPSTYRLQGFGGSNIPVIGQVKIPCQRKGRKYNLVLQVVDVSHGPLLSANVCRILGFVKFCNTVKFTAPKSEQELLNIYRVKAQDIVKQHEEVFQGIGKFSGTVSLEVSPDITPSIQPPRRVPIAMREKLKEELKNLECDGVIVKETQHTDWVSNIVLVKRKEQKSESVRICLDPIPLNKALKRPHLQFTTIDEILPELGKAKVFSTADARKGFWHVVLDERSSRLTTFWTPFGRYRWTRLPFGIAPAPDIFQMKLLEVIEGLHGVECIADDLLIYGIGDTLEEALENHNVCLEKLLVRLEKCNVKLNLSKLKLFETSVKFYGHMLTNKGIQPDESKVTAIKKFPRPADRKQLQRFIGMVNYLSRFIPNLSANFTILRRLISEKEAWIWSEKEDEEFDRVKRLVADTGTLQYYNKKNYAQIEKELLAILFACVRFDQLIVGNPKTTIKTDHKPLVNVFQKPLLSAPRRLQHMLLNLQRYRLTIEFVTGKENVVADAISRAPSYENRADDSFDKRNIFRVFREIEQVSLSSFLEVKDEQLNEIIGETKADPSLQLLVRFVQDGWPSSVDKVPDSAKVFFKYRNELSTQDGIVYRNDRIVVPYSLRRKLTEKVHVSHNGIEATLKLARANLFWPGMSAQIKEVVSQCSVCAKFGSSQSPAPMQSHPIPVYPFQLVSMDIFFAEYQGKNRKWLVTVDHFSDFFEVDQLKDLTPKSTIAVCKSNFSRHGKPQQVISDNGTNFVNREWKQFARDWNFYHTTSAPHHQQANGKAEAAVKIAKRLLKKAEEAQSDFWYALLHWRNVPNKIGSSPATRLFSRNTRCGIPTSANNLMPKLVAGVPQAIEERRRKTKLQYDRKTKNLPQLETGSPVYVQLNPEISKRWTPAMISNKLNERSYVIDVNGAQYRRDLVNLKPRNEPQTPKVIPDPATIPNVEPLAAEKSFNEPSFSTVTENTIPNRTSIPSIPDAIFLEETRTPKPMKTPRIYRPSSDPVIEEDKYTRSKRSVKLPIRFKDYCLD
ncbi:uncharacterized protein K02A2.6-like [Topomyia yanbarensis]|uniref:uncharacterized protein K02A2.6-like n=1 Tax=Topomyia yanbarensis TaxID=2498891 RepID=UPI00273C0585|nr:uncharacterized protein K02A2.6-like [Topomyia yanbarensis]